MRAVKILLIVLLVGAGIAATVIFGPRYLNPQPPVDDKHIRLSGNIEVTDVEVSFKIPGRVTQRLVSEGELVKSGQLVATLDDAELKNQLTMHQSEVKTAEAALAELEAGSRPEEIAQAAATVTRLQSALDELKAGSRAEEIAQAEADVKREEAERDRLTVEQKRYNALVADDAITHSARDTIAAQYLAAQARVAGTGEHLKLLRAGPRREDIDQAAAALSEAQAKLALIKAGPRAEEITQARSRLQQARDAVALAQTQLSFTQLFAPLSGMVLSHHIEAGEFAAAGTPIVTAGDLEHPWLRAYINETDLGRVKLGQTVAVTTDTYPGKQYQGRLDFIAAQAEFTPKNVQTDKERVKLVYRVKIYLANPNLELKPGMPADAVITTE